MIDEVAENLLVGDAGSVLDECRLQLFAQLRITHVLTVSTESIPEEKRVKGVCYMFVYALDLETQDMFASNALANSLQYISGSVETGGRVLVHCEAGISRSVFVIAAYLMKKFRWSSKEAVQYIQRIRPMAQPNDGFLQQLQIFNDANFETDIEIISRCPSYKKWLLVSSSFADRVPGMWQETSSYEQDKESSVDVQSEYRCRKCRRTLFYDDHIIRHTVSTDEATQEVACDVRYLLLPMKWMSLKEYQGKITCPTCGEKVGRYVWGGRVCDGVDGRPCGTAVRPWTYINQNKIDRRVRSSSSAGNPAGIVINKPPEQKCA